MSLQNSLETFLASSLKLRERIDEVELSTEENRYIIKIIAEVEDNSIKFMENIKRELKGKKKNCIKKFQ